MTEPVSSIARVQAALRQAGVECPVLELPGSTRTAEEAAGAVGCDLGQIVKSLVFRGQETRAAYLFLVSGRNRLDESMVRPALPEAIERADPAFVREQTGYAIGGVPPVGFPSPLASFMDRDLLQYPDVWAAAGTPRSVFNIVPGELARITGARVLQVC